MPVGLLHLHLAQLHLDGLREAQGQGSPPRPPPSPAHPSPFSILKSRNRFPPAGTQRTAGAPAATGNISHCDQPVPCSGAWGGVPSSGPTPGAGHTVWLRSQAFLLSSQRPQRNKTNAHAVSSAHAPSQDNSPFCTAVPHSGMSRRRQEHPDSRRLPQPARAGLASSESCAPGSPLPRGESPPRAWHPHAGAVPRCRCFGSLADGNERTLFSAPPGEPYLCVGFRLCKFNLEVKHLGRRLLLLLSRCFLLTHEFSVHVLSTERSWDETYRKPAQRRSVIPQHLHPQPPSAPLPQGAGRGSAGGSLGNTHDDG